MEKYFDEHVHYTRRAISEVTCDQCGVLVKWNSEHGRQIPCMSIIPKRKMYYHIKRPYGDNTVNLDLCDECFTAFTRSKQFVNLLDVGADRGILGTIEVSARIGELPDIYDQDEERLKLRAERRSEEMVEVLCTNNWWPHLEIRNEFTEACDEYLTDSWVESIASFHTALATELFLTFGAEVVDHKVTVPFRFPGATRGAISVDLMSNTITEVFFDRQCAWGEGIGCYKPEIAELQDRFTGYTFKGDTGFLIRAFAERGERTYYDSHIRYDYEKEDTADDEPRGEA